MKNFFVHLILVLFVCCLGFSRNASGLFAPYDGSYRKEMIKNTYEWSRLTSNASINPLQGLGDLTYPFNFRLSPACLINHYFHKHDVSSLLIYTVITLELFAAIYWFAGCLGFAAATRLLGAWLSIVFIMPFVPATAPAGFFNLYAISSIIPDVVEEMAITLVILGMITRIKLDPLSALLKYALGLSLAIAYVIIQYPLHCILCLPLIGLYALYTVALKAWPHKQWGRMGIFLLVIWTPLIFPLIYVAGWFIRSAAIFFPGDFPPPGAPALELVSTLFHGFCKMGWIGSVAFMLGFLGAGWAIRREQGRIRSAAVFYMLYSFGIVGGGLLFAFVLVKYRVPVSLYFEWFIWPFMFLYTAYVLGKISDVVAGKLNPYIQDRVLALPAWVKVCKERIEQWGDYWKQVPSHRLFIYGGGLGLLVCMISMEFFQESANRESLGYYPPKNTIFNGKLREMMELSPGGEWKGCIATITEIKPTGTTWDDQCAWDFVVWNKTGSEYRAICMWWHNIPTMFVYSPARSPEYHYMMTRLFATPEAIQHRNVFVLTKPNTKLLGIFGTRVLITNRPLPADQLSAVEPMSEAPKEIHAYELKRVNTAGYAPSTAIRCQTAAETIKVMTRDDFDPWGEAVVYEEIPFGLKKVDRSEMIWGRNDVHVTAHSSGASLLVLPLQYSHCLKFKSRLREGEKPRMIRVNMTLTGILFDGELDISIKPHYGPFTNVFGRFKDYHELKSLQLH